MKRCLGRSGLGGVETSSENKLLLSKREVVLSPRTKVTRVEPVAKPRDLEEFVFAEYMGGVLTELPPWFPREFQVGETSAAGVLRRSRQNPDKHFIQANRRMFRLPTDRDFEVWKHVEMEKSQDWNPVRKSWSSPRNKMAMTLPELYVYSQWKRRGKLLKNSRCHR